VAASVRSSRRFMAMPIDLGKPSYDTHRL